MTHFEYKYKLTHITHYTITIDAVTGGDWQPGLNEDVYLWLQDNMERGVDYEYDVGDTTTTHSTDMYVGLAFATEESAMAFKLVWV